jgi:ParB/RepB/Spo0J family partition protein
VSAEILELPLSQVSPDPEQHRRWFDPEALKGLAESIVANGQLDPVKVIRLGEGWQVIDGERRYRACLLAGMDTIRAIVLEVDEGQRLAIQAAANLARENPRPCEEARAYAKIIMHARDCLGLSDEEAKRRAARETSKSVQRVGFKLRLLSLPTEVQDLVDKGALGEGQALALGPLAEAAEEAEAVRQARKCVAEGSTVAEVRARVAAYLGAQAQGSLFGAGVAKRSEAGKAAAEGVSRIIGHLECVADLSFDERAQRATVQAGALTAQEVQVAVARLRGGMRHLEAIVEALEGKAAEVAEDSPEAIERDRKREVQALTEKLAARYTALRRREREVKAG